MSSQNLKAKAQEILNDLARTGEKEHNNTLARRQLLTQPGQIFIVFRDRFDEVIRATVQEEANTKATQEVIDGAYEVYKSAVTFTDNAIKKAIRDEWSKIKSMKSMNKQEFEDLIDSRLDELKNTAKSLKRSGTEVFVVSKYKTIVTKGNAKLKAYLEQQYKGKVFKKVGGTGLKEGDKYGQQIGHADNVTGGVASSSVRALSAERLINSGNLNASDKVRLSDIVQTLKDGVGLEISHESVVDNDGNIRKEYIPILTYQEAWVNQGQSGTEAELFKAFERAIKDITTDENSLSLSEQVASVIFHNTAGKPQKNKKTTGRKNKKEKSKNTGQANKTFKRQTAVKVNKGTGLTASALKPKVRKAKSSGSTLFGLVALLNQQLPNTVRKNMGPPGLESVTGRFANSVRVTDITKTAKGYPSIGYTYRKDPYQVFEVGMGRAPWASTERDPKKLIDRSIREIAANLAIGRFYTRRN